MKIKLCAIAALCGSLISGCGTITPQDARDIITDAITNRPPVVENPTPPVENSITNVQPPAITNQPQAGILQSAKWNRFPRVDFVAPEIEKWPRTGEKNVCAQLFLNGRKVEWIAAGRQFSSVVNATVAGGKYFQPMKSGDTCTISIADLNGKNESNRITLVIP